MARLKLAKEDKVRPSNKKCNNNTNHRALTLDQRGYISENNWFQSTGCQRYSTAFMTLR